MVRLGRQLLHSLRATPLLHAVLVLAMTPVVALALAMPAYAQAASARLLAFELEDPTLNRPNFAYLFGHSGSLNGPIAWSEVDAVDEWMTGEALDSLGLPLLHQSRYIQSVGFSTSHEGTRLGPTYIGALSDLEQRAAIVAGRFPDSAQIDGAGVVIPEVAVSESFATAHDLGPGDLLTFDSSAALGDREGRAVIVGMWAPQDADAPEWAIHPVHLEQWLFADEAVLIGAIGPDVAGIRSVGWYGLTDGTGLTTDAVDGVTDRTRQVTRQAQSQLPTIRRELDPVDSLQQFRLEADKLTRRLLAVSLPTLATLAVFVAVVVSLRRDRRSREVALLRSRGASRSTIASRAAVESVVLLLVAGLFGWLLAPPLVRFMGGISSFLGRAETEAISTALPRSAALIGMVSIVVLLVALVAPTLWGTPETIIDHRQRRGRTAVAPWWQRTKADVVVIALASFGVVMAVRRRPAAAPTDLTSSGGTAITDDPMIVLIPALASLAAGLLALRLLPILFSGLARVLERTSSITGLLTARRLARAPGASFLPMLLLVLAVATGIVTASFARTLDTQLTDTQWHLAGADVSFQDAAVVRSPPSVSPTGEVSQAQAAISLTDLVNLPAVASASRIGSWGADVNRQLPDAEVVTWVGVDAETFATTAFSRSDYARESFDGLMQRVAADPTGVLVDVRSGRSVGDVLQLRVFVDGRQIVELPVTVVGEVSLFPTWRPDDGPIVVGDLGRLFAETRESWDYRTLLRLEPGADLSVEDVRTLGFVTDFDRPATEVADRTAAPGRQGVFAMLSLGFISALSLSIAGFWFTSVHSAQQARADLGLIRALGVPARRASTMVVLDLVFLAGAGLAVGGFTGLALSRFLLPRIIDTATVPPLRLEVAWSQAVTIAALITAALLVVCGVLIVVARRQRLLTATRLGAAT